MPGVGLDVGRIVRRCVGPLGSGRRANPFAAESHAPGAIAWLGASGQRDLATLDAILDRLAPSASRRGACGQITGPHGTGKTTLLTHLAARARERGWIVSESRPPSIAWPMALPTEPRDHVASDTPKLACIDSADQMSRARWALLRVRARVNGVMLLVTTHRDLGCVDVATREMDIVLARRVLEHLAAPGGLTLPSDAELGDMLARHNSSLRHVIFELYDVYERGWPW
jgi:hypothetical protein